MDDIVPTITIDDLLIEQEEIINETGVRFIHLIGEQLQIAKEKIIEQTGDKRAPGFIKWANDKFNFAKRTTALYIRAWRENITEPEIVWDNKSRGSLTAPIGDSIDVINGGAIVGDAIEEMAKLPDESIDMIFTDPPYDEESIPLYGLMAEQAKRILKPGSSLITYAGHYAIGQIINDVSEYLRYWWIIALKHSGKSARLPGKWVFVEWKPLLWFVKDGRNNNNYVSDYFKSIEPEKKLHDWEQSIAEANYYIDLLTNPGDMILDPFCGSGTTLIAAKKLKRNVRGFDNKQVNINITNYRLNNLRIE